MKTKSQKKAAAPAALSAEARRLINSAAQQPGIVEMFKVYESWQRFDQAFEAQNRFWGPKQIVTTSSSCNPVLCPVA